MHGGYAIYMSTWDPCILMYMCIYMCVCQVFHGEFKYVPSATFELFDMFSHLFDWIAGDHPSHTHTLTATMGVIVMH